MSLSQLQALPRRLAFARPPSADRSPAEDAHASTAVRAFLRGSFWSLGARFINVGSLLLLNALLARLLAPAEFGSYLLAYSASVVVGMAAALGLHNAAPKLLGEAHARDDAGALWSAVIAIAIVFSTAAVVVGAVMFLGAGWFFREVLTGHDDLAALLGLIVGWIIFASLRMVIANGLRSLDYPATGSLFDGALASFLTLIIVIGGWSLGRPVGLYMAVAAAFVGSAVSAVLGLVVFLRVLSEAAPPTWGRAPPLGSLLRLSVPMMMIGLVGQLSYQMPLWLIGSLGTPADVARYGVGAQIFICLNFFFAATMLGAMPIIVRLNARNDRPALRRFLHRASLISALPMVAAVLLFALFGSEIMVLIFGPFYSDSARIATFLSLGLLSQAALGLNPLLLTLTGSQDIVSIVQCGILLFCTAIIWFFYPVFGMEGASIVTAGLFLMQNLALVGIVKRRFGFIAVPLWHS